MDDSNAHSDEPSHAANLTPGLYIVGTPIGNLRDISLRALDVLRQCHVIYAEDTRVTSRLLARYEIRKPLVSHHKFNEQARFADLTRRINTGEAVALVSDSGMPGVSDPGGRLVRLCRENGYPVSVIPGPSALASAISLCGMEATGYVFGGFLPHKSGARRRMLAQLARAGLPVILYESPYRLIKLMEELKATFLQCDVYVGRELTKKFEESLYGSPDDIVTAFSKRTVKGELVVVVKFEASPDVDSADAP